MKMSIRTVTITGILGSISIVLGVTGLGFIPLPITPVGRATILHIPTILAAIMEGPLVGGMVGFIFGLSSYYTAVSALSADPIVAIVPRILIGVVSYYVYALFRRKPLLGAGLAAAAGTLTNTIGFLGLGVLRGYIKWIVVWTVVASHSIFEVILAVIIVIAVFKALQRYRPQL